MDREKGMVGGDVRRVRAKVHAMEGGMEKNSKIHQ